MGAVQHLRRSTAEPGDETDRVNVVRLVEFLGPISPELALVDPELAARARALLPDTPGIRFHRRDRVEVPPLRVVEAQPPTPRRWRITTAVALATAASAAFGLGVSAAASGDLEAGATPDVTATPRPPVAAAETSPSQTASPPVRPAVAPRFVWAPENGVRRYRFALYRGKRLVFEKDVRSTSIELPRAWSFNGRFHELGAGRYRWVVSPYVGAAGRLGPAIVSADYTG